MEEKKFCKFCGEQIDKNCIVCPKCGRQLEEVKEDPPEHPNINQEKSTNSENSKPKFQEQEWFMWVMLIIFTPIGIFLMFKFNKRLKLKTKIILSIVFGIMFLIKITGKNNNNQETTNQYESNNKVEVTVVDFSQLGRTDIDSWCNTNKINCKITDKYSDTVEKGRFISQSTTANTTIYEGDKIIITYSLGKEPTTEYKNALKKAENYSEIMHMSKQAIYDQLTSEYGEKFTKEAAQYAIDNIEADWNANALAKAKSYQSTMSMSKSAIYDQLISEYGEKFTKEEAQYAIDHLDD